MPYNVFRWASETPYQDKNKRNASRPKPLMRSVYPWASMLPGDFFLVPIASLRDSENIKSLSNSIRNSARLYGIWVRISALDYPNRGPSILVRHDGYIK